jgi:hypothetical protein
MNTQFAFVIAYSRQWRDVVDVESLITQVDIGELINVSDLLTNHEFSFQRQH